VFCRLGLVIRRPLLAQNVHPLFLSPGGTVKVAAPQQDETPVIVAYWIAQLRAVSRKVHNVGGNGSIYLDLTRTYIS